MLPGRSASFAAVLLLCGTACGGRSPIVVSPPFDASATAATEQCNGLDDDGDGKLDEGFRDAQGNYLSDAHCGSCGHSCNTPIANAVSVGCELLRGTPTCVARSCAPGFGPSQSGGCTALDDHLCMSCRDAGNCGTLLSARCVAIGGEQRCTHGCERGCPAGYSCEGGDHCAPVAGSCECSAGAPDFTLACELRSVLGRCAGQARCQGGVLSACTAGQERCDGADDDCDGKIDEGFADAVGAYSLDPANCGACGVDCNRDADAGVTLACGGDPFEPSCVTFCPDTLDGVQLGDHVDANRNLADGCECVVRALSDSSGAPAVEGQLDANCDGADGNVLSSYYVSVGGDDGGPGSPTHPLRSIGVAIARAAASLGGSQPRPDVYVASGIYTESVTLLDGVRVHGGYRSDFLARNPSGFEVVVVAPADSPALGGAALTGARVGLTPTLIEDVTFRGRDAAQSGEPAIGVLLRDPGPQLSLQKVRVRSGRPGAGRGGAAGQAGAAPSTAAADGAAPRAAIEDSAHDCQPGAANRGMGGGGGRNLCGGLDVSGGSGGSTGCPSPAAREASGLAGRAASGASPGAAGQGGTDLTGPLVGRYSCPGTCCGLSDFEVPTVFVQATPGGAGGNGLRGVAGAACADPIGSVSAALDLWFAGTAQNGRAGSAGGGGGGGGAGGGVHMDWISSVCEFADGLGGGGGGGGAGGCGGSGGGAGSSGGLAIGILIHASSVQALPVLDGVEVITQDGGSGGDGGAGGDGGLGGGGAFGGSVPEALRSTPTLAGPMPGERGGVGGDGGAGGGGGGGCGGSAIGLWLTGLGNRPDLRARLQSGNLFTLGAGGAGGRGGGGAVPAAAGATGNSVDVLVQ